MLFENVGHTYYVLNYVLGGSRHGREGPDGAALSTAVTLQDGDGLKEPLVHVLVVRVEANVEVVALLKKKSSNKQRRLTAEIDQTRIA